MNEEFLREQARIILDDWYAEDLIRHKNLSREDVEIPLVNVLTRRARFPDLPKDEIVGCMCNFKGWKTMSSSEDCGVVCKKEEPRGSEKVAVECFPCNDEDCSICLEPLSSAVRMTGCGHKFHHHCFETFAKQYWQALPCPLCRTHVSTWSLKQVRDVYNMYANCRCCARHQTRRPKVLSMYAPWIQTLGCGSDLAIVLRSLLQFRDRRTVRTFCKCRGYDGTSCRAQVRDVLLRLPF
jgi:hypothetical protein